MSFAKTSKKKRKKLMSSVTDLAALASVVAGDGDQVFVQTLKDNFILDVASALTPDGATIIAATGGGNWLRMEISHPSHRIGVTDVYINDSIGSVEGVGIYSAPQGTPDYITSAEFTRRWGTLGRIVQTGDPTGLEIRIHVDAPIVAPDALEFAVLTAPDTFVRGLGLTTIVRSGTLDATAGFVVQVPTAAGGGTANIIKDSAGGAWNPGERVHFPATGATAYVLQDLGGGQARISEPQTTDEPGFSVVPTTVSIANGAAWEVLDTIAVNWGRVSIQSANKSAFGFGPQNNFADMKITTTIAVLVLAYELYPNSFNVFYRCQFRSGVALTANVIAVNCQAQAVQDDWGGNGAPCGWYGGAIVKPTGATGPCFARLSQGLGDVGSVDYGTHVQGGYVYFHALFTAGRFAVWDTVAESIVNPNGDAIIVGSGNSHRLLTGAMGGFRDRAGIPIFGNGAAGAGLRLAPGVTATYESSAVPRVTGSRDLQFGPSTVGWWWDELTANYQPLGAGINLSWTSLVATSSPTGFGGSAHDPDRNIHLVQAA
jgi:hypothetical protein